MRSVSGNIRFVRSYPLASFGRVQNFERTPPDKDVRWMNVFCALVCGLSGSHASGILYVYVDVRSTRAVERSISGHVTVKTDEYRMLNGQETHITDGVYLSMKQDSAPSIPHLTHPPYIIYSFRFLISHERMFQEKGDSECFSYVVSESALNEIRRSIRIFHECEGGIEKSAVASGGLPSDDKR